MKFGMLDEVYMNQIVDGINEFNSIKDSLLNQVSRSQKKKPEPFLAEITGVTEMTEIEIERFGGIEEEIFVAWAYEFTKILTTIVAEGDQDHPIIQPAFAVTDPPIVSEDFRVSTGLDNSGYCFNLAELSNEQTYTSEGKIFGIDVSAESYPEDYLPQPMLVGSKVMLTRNTTQNGEVIFFFDRQGVHEGSSESTRTFLVEITKAKVIAVQESQLYKAYKFSYAWNSVTIDGSYEYSATTDTGSALKTSTFGDDEFYYPAINAVEIRNTENYATGILIYGESYLRNYFPQPFGGATGEDLTGLIVGSEVDLHQNLITFMRKFTDADGVVGHIFNHMMLHDGGCDL